jgi:hypothetical protein
MRTDSIYTYVARGGPLISFPLFGRPIVPGRRSCPHGRAIFYSFSGSWTCACGRLVEWDDVAHDLGCIRLSGLHDDTADSLRYFKFVGCMGFCSSREARYSRLAPRATNSPQARWELLCHLRPGPGYILGYISLLIHRPRLMSTKPPTRAPVTSPECSPLPPGCTPPARAPAGSKVLPAPRQKFKSGMGSRAALEKSVS